jgi:hypothetical protein
MQSSQGVGSGSVRNYPVSVLKMKMDNQRIEGEAAKKLIDSASKVTQGSNRAAQSMGLGRRVDVSA